MQCRDDVIQFIRERVSAYRNFTDQEIKDIINKHIEYGTYDEFRDGDKLVAIVRGNIEGNIVNILDIIIRDGFDTGYIVKRFALRAWERFPSLKYIKFHRMYKYPLRKATFWSIKRLLGIKEK